MKRIIIFAIALIVTMALGYFVIGTYINKYFKGRIIDIIGVIFIMCLMLVLMSICLNIADHFFSIFPK